MAQLKKCPFCGGEVLLDREDIFCDECHVSMRIDDRLMNREAKTYEEAREQTITAWNTRKPMQRIEEMLDEAMERQWGYYNKAKGEGNIRQMDYSDGCAEGLTTAIELLEEELN